MREALKVFTPQQWVIIIAAGANAIVGGRLLWMYFNSRWWRESVTNPEGRAVAGDVQKHGSWMLACALTVAIVVAKLGYQREAGLDVDTLVIALLSYSGVLQNNKRLSLKDALDAAKPTPPPAPGTTIDATNATLTVGPNSSTSNAE